MKKIVSKEQGITVEKAFDYLCKVNKGYSKMQLKGSHGTVLFRYSKKIASIEWIPMNGLMYSIVTDY